MAAPSYLRYTNQGATRNQHLAPDLVNALGFLGDLGITAEVFSGGQPGKGSGGARVGSTRHDHGNAADVRFFQGDRRLDWANPQDLPLFEQIVSLGRKAGLTGFGAGPGYMGAGTMHVGFGSPGVWGAGGKAANAPEWLRNAYNGSSSPAGGTQVASASGAISDILGTSAAPQSAMAYGGDTVAQGGRMGGLGGMGGWDPPKAQGSDFVGTILQALGAGAAAGDLGVVPAYLQQAFDQQRSRNSEDYERAWREYAFRTGLEENALDRQQQLEQVDYTRSQDAITNDYRERQLAASLRPTVAEPPSSVREYEYARSQGFEGTFADWETQNRRAGATNVTVGANGSKFSEETDKLAATRLNEIVAAGNGASQFLGDIQQLASLGKEINTGLGAQALVRLGPYADALGIDVEGLGPAQAYESIISRLAPQMRPAGSGAASDFDARQFLQSLPTIGNTQEGNIIITDTFQAIQRNKIEAAEIASLAMRPPEQGGLTWQEAERRIRELPNPYERFKAYRETGSVEQPADTTPRVGGVPVGGQTPVMAGSGSSAPNPTAINPQTGERIQWNGREWMPVQ